MMYYFGNSFGSGWWWGGPLMMLAMVVFWCGVIAFVVWLVREAAGKNSRSGRSSALDILEERYAKGEISQAEYLEKKKDLRS
ncbi:MAG: SHOCT domain-containing protein [Patescibacteria group bacterium]|jgi:putative membrane protein